MAREYSRGSARKWAREHPLELKEQRRKSKHVRRLTLAGIPSVVKIKNDNCAICGDPLDETIRFPDPLSVTVGHEPPVSVARKLGLTSITERYEHWSCNYRKLDRTDDELAA